MVIDVILLFIVAAIASIGYFLIRALPILQERTTEAIRHEHGPHSGMYLLERRLHETEGPDAVGRTEPFYGADATFAAARDHFALADAYDDEWHQRFPSEPAARPRAGVEAVSPITATAPDIDVVGESPAVGAPTAARPSAPAPVAVHGELVQQPIVAPPEPTVVDEGPAEAA
jgi:hypothetical protein